MMNQLEAVNVITAELTRLGLGEIAFTKDMMNDETILRTLDGSFNYSISNSTLWTLTKDGLESLKEFAQGIAEKAGIQTVAHFREGYKRDVISELSKLLNMGAEIEEESESLLIKFYNWRMRIPNTYIKDSEDCGHPAIQTATVIAEGIQHEFSYWIRSKASLPKHVGGRSFIEGDE